MTGQERTKLVPAVAMFKRKPAGAALKYNRKKLVRAELVRVTLLVLLTTTGTSVSVAQFAGASVGVRCKT